MKRYSEFLAVATAAGPVTIETYIDGDPGVLDVVVLPSYGRDGGEDFDAFTAALAGAGFRALRPQPRGVAGSSGPMTDVSIEELADDVAQVIERCGAGRPAVVLGHAFGNFVARVIATSRPELVRAVILAAASTQAPPPEINGAPFRAGDPTLPEEERLAALRLAFFAPGHDPSIWLSGWYPQTLAMQHTAVVNADLDQYWGAGHVPILEILAALDPFHPEDQWNDLREQLGDRVTTVVVEGASHALFPEQPAAVADEVIGYLRTLG